MGRRDLSRHALSLFERVVAKHRTQSMNKAGSVWNTDEIKIIVEDYLAMLRMQLVGARFNKAERNRALQQSIGRTKTSIEYKHQNISAVMIKLGLPFIWGYKPASNFQARLYEVIADQLVRSNLLDRLSRESREPTVPNSGLTFQEPPPKTNSLNHSNPIIQQILRALDPAARDARTRALGQAGEKFLFHAEQNRLLVAGRDDLSQRVRWVSKEDGDGAGFDILSFSEFGEERWLEVKTTNAPSSTPFWICRNELRVSEERRDVFRLTRLYDFSRAPAAFQLTSPLTDHVNLTATQYHATL